ncbi:hypothetical protein [Mesorhizobium sp. INR15]|uniref:hypothetical protein n=1 Tax=Mesorhizobium sp. INR15 TaxID=2654248 RepID=UPI001896A1AE|nr:hypothetical protein [Mesorhizobium sp. INR15]QPC91318.1 hypothetical protein GA829_12270 [Mesorhizobium sp. INR15]
MIDIREIGARARELEALDDLLSKFMALPSAQAVTVRVMPWLLLDYDGYRAFARYSDFLSHAIGYPLLFEDMWIGPEFANPFMMPGRNQPDLDWDAMQDRFQDDRISEHLIGREKPRDPFHIELHVRQDAYDLSQAEIVRRLANDSPLFVTVQRRGAMKLQFASGDLILSGGKSGTIGGFIADHRGTVYGLTCSHVASGGVVTDVTGRKCGDVKASTTQVSMASGSVCHPNPRRGSPTCAINSLDLALVEMSVAATATGLKLGGSVAQGDIVDVGASRSSYRFGVRSLCIAMQLGLNSVDYCYSPLIELYSPAGTTWPSDSGAWGLTNQFSEWATVMVGADSVSSFAIDARDAADWIDTCGIVSAGAWSVY